MLRALAAIAAAASLAAAAPVAAPGGALAAAPDGELCATHARFVQIQRGDTVARVRTIFHGLPGQLVWQDDVGGHHLTERAYKPCSPTGFVRVQYSDGRETHKYGYFPG